MEFASVLEKLCAESGEFLHKHCTLDNASKHVHFFSASKCLYGAFYSAPKHWEQEKFHGSERGGGKLEHSATLQCKEVIFYSMPMYWGNYVVEMDKKWEVGSSATLCWDRKAGGSATS
eukprot:15327535-Ditylum_brightwellii.AAC.1